MGTYTTNYNLFMPTVGETGWGTLVNGNFETIDTTMKSLSNRITTCESYGARITAVENEVNGALSCTSVTTSGKITGNGGIAGTTGTFSGAVTGASFNGIVLKSSGTITVTPITGTFILPQVSDSGFYTGCLTVLPPVSNAVYSGSLTIKPSESNSAFIYYDGTTFERKTRTISSATTFNFTNIPFLLANGNPRMTMSKFKLS